MDTKSLRGGMVTLSRIESLLQQIDQNGRASSEEVWHKRRSEIDNEQVTVHLRCNIISLGDIDNVTQEYKAEIYLAARWKEPQFSGMKREDIDWSEQWSPRIVFENCTNIESLTTKHNLVYDTVNPDDIPEVNQSLRLTGTFKEILELSDFPFDAQDLSIKVRSDWPDKDVKLVKDMKIKDSVATKRFSAIHSWQILPHIVSEPCKEDQDKSGSHRKYPAFLYTIHVKRKMGYYLWNVMLIMFLIMLMTFSSLVVDPLSPSDRLSVTLTLLLTAVAFKYVVAQSLPQISYLTILDVYVIGCLIFQFLMVIQNSVAGLFSTLESAREFDMISLYTFIAICGLFHLILLIIIVIKINKRNKKLSTITIDYNLLCETINEGYLERKRQEKAALERKQSGNSNIQGNEKQKKKKSKHKLNQVEEARLWHEEDEEKEKQELRNCGFI